MPPYLNHTDAQLDTPSDVEVERIAANAQELFDAESRPFRDPFLGSLIEEQLSRLISLTDSYTCIRENEIPADIIRHYWAVLGILRTSTQRTQSFLFASCTRASTKAPDLTNRWVRNDSLAQGFPNVSTPENRSRSASGSGSDSGECQLARGMDETVEDSASALQQWPDAVGESPARRQKRCSQFVELVYR